MELSIVERLNKYSSVKQYKYYKMLIQEFHIKLDIGFINAIIKMTEKYELSEEERVCLIDFFPTINLLWKIYYKSKLIFYFS